MLTIYSIATGLLRALLKESEQHVSSEFEDGHNNNDSVI